MKRAKPNRGKILAIASKTALWMVLMAAVGGIVYLSLFRPPPPKRTVTVVVKAGQNTAQIADLLAEKGVISNARTFRAYAAITQTEARLQPGTYRLKTGQTYYRILQEMTKKQYIPMVRVVIPEGFTATQIAARLAETTGRPAADFYEYIRGQGVSQVRPSQLPPDLNTLEGYLFPKTYLFEAGIHPKKVIARMVEQFQREIEPIDWTFARQKNLTTHQIITIASLIEEEAKVPDERPLMAAVIYNRLDRGMPLQIDATVQYALPQRKEALTNQDLKIASPYNTYQQTGLPPGPIANPGIDSINAALAPAPADYLYYVLTSADGRHTFTNSYDQFLAAKRRAQGN